MMDMNINDSNKRVNTTDLFSSDDMKEITKEQYIKVPAKLMENREISGFERRILLHGLHGSDGYRKFEGTQQDFATTFKSSPKRINKGFAKAMKARLLKKDGRGQYTVLTQNFTDRSGKYCKLPFRALTTNLLTSIQFDVLLLLCRHVNNFGQCRLNQKTIARFFNIDQSSVSRALRILVKLGFIISEDTRGKGKFGGICNFLVLYRENPAIKAAAEKLKKATVESVKFLEKKVEQLEEYIVNLSENLTAKQPPTLRQKDTISDKVISPFCSKTSIYTTNTAEQPTTKQTTGLDRWHRNKQQREQLKADQAHEKFLASKYSSQQDDGLGQSVHEMNMNKPSDTQNEPQSTWQSSFTGKIKSCFTKAGIFTPNQSMSVKSYSLDEMWEANL